MSMQVIYVSSRTDEALLEALRREPFPDAQHEPHEVSSQVAMLLQNCVTRVQPMLRNLGHSAQQRCPAITASIA